MTRISLAFSLFMILGFGSACQVQDELVFEEAVPVDVEGMLIEYQLERCWSDADCHASETFCSLHEQASLEAGQALYACRLGCTSTVTRIETTHADGTYTVSTVRSDDSCTREGDALFCDNQQTGDVGKCLKLDYMDVPIGPPPTDPNPPVVTNMVTIGCCYVAEAEELWGQFSWSESTMANPEAWGAARDLEADSNTCFWAEVDMSKVLDGVYGVFNAGMTVGYHDGSAEWEVGFWISDKWRPNRCYIGGQNATIGDLNQAQGWPFRL